MEIKKTIIIVLFTLVGTLLSAQTMEANQYMIWGIGEDEISIPAGSVITEAVLTIQNVTPQTASLYIHLLDNTKKGNETGKDTGTGDFFESCGVVLSGAYENGDYVCRFSQNDNPQSPIRAIFPSPTSITLADSSTVGLSSSLLELMDYAGNGKGFGIGIQNGSGGSIDLFSIQLQVTLKSFITISDPATRTFYNGLSDNSGLSGLVGYWKLDENATSNIVINGNVTGSNGVSSVNTSTLHTSGCVDGGFQFSNGQSVTIADYDGIDMGTGDFSVSFAFRLDGFNTSASWNAVLSKGSFATTGSYYGLYVPFNNKLYFIVGGVQNFACSNNALNDGQYHHVSAIRLSGQLMLYVDGVLQYKTGFYAGDVSNDLPLTFGSDSSLLRYFRGALDEIRIHNYALTESENTDLALQAIGSRCGLMNYWSMDDNNNTYVVQDGGSDVRLHGRSSLYTSVMHTEGSVNGGFQFSGTKNIVVPDYSTLDMKTKDFSISFAIKVDGFNTSASWNTVMSKGLMAATGAFYGLYIPSNYKLYFLVGGIQNFACSNGALNDGKYHHITAIRSSGQLSLYVDGVLQNKTGSCTDDLSNTSPLVIGTDNTASRYFLGSLDEIRFYNHGLKNSEIDELNSSINK